MIHFIIRLLTSTTEGNESSFLARWHLSSSFLCVVAGCILLPLGVNCELQAQETESPPTGSTSESVRTLESASDSPAGPLEVAEQLAFQRAVSAVSPFVVQIETFGGLDRVEDKSIAAGPITGTIIDPEGWIIASSYGLNQQLASILVNLPNGNRVPARIVARDYSRELVLLKVDSPDSLPMAIGSEPASWQVGQWCIAVGKTYDINSVTQSHGIISALGRAYGRAVQTDAKVSPINYGGPLVDIYGKVIGILTPIAAAEMLGDDGTVLYDSGIGFAVPLPDIMTRLPALKAGNDIRAGKLGVVTADANEMAGPVKLTGAAPGSPAAKAGIMAGDIIVRAQGQPVDILADLRHALASTDAGEPFSLTVQRGEQLIDIRCELVAEIPVYRRRFLGMQVEASDSGLIIRSLVPASPAALAGLEVGQLVTHCDGKQVSQRADLASLLAVADLEKELRLSIRAAEENSVREVAIVPAKWPEKLMEHDSPPWKPAVSDGSPKDPESTELTELKFADIPNKIFAIIPPKSVEQQVGCLVVYSQPGELSVEKLKSNWQRLAVDYGWLVVFPVSVNPQAWSRDEMELASRLLKRLDQEYSLDRSRTVIGGMGVGGQLALVAALVEKERVSGVFTLGTQLRRFPLRIDSAPLQTLDFLLVGNDSLETIVEQLTQAGFVANQLSAEIDFDRWETVPMDALVRWLEILAYL